MPKIIDNLGAGTANPQFIQYGNRCFYVAEDVRPRYAMASMSDSTLKSYHSAIKPPTAAPTAVSSSDAAVNLDSVAGTDAIITYKFGSSKRVVQSQLSPTVTYSIPMTPKKITISGFQAPRDDAATQDIDQIYVCVFLGTAPGQMCLVPTMVIDVPNLDFTSKSFTFDIAPDDLYQGVNMSAADVYYALPPAFRYVEQIGERLWCGGQARQFEFSGSDVALTKGQAFRPSDENPTRAKVVISGTGTFSDKLYWTSVWIDGSYCGEVFDVLDSTTLYLDRDVSSNISSTSQFYFTGHNDRLYPSTWMSFTPDNVPTVYPECVNLTDVTPLPTVLDQGELLKGLTRIQGNLAVIFNQSVLIGNISDAPGPASGLMQFQQLYGRMGTMAPRSITKAPDGGAFWIGEEGPILGDTAGLDSIAYQLNSNLLFKGGIWIDLTSMPDIVATYTRQWDGYVLGNLVINGEENWWAVVTFKPQFGIWLHNGQEITSNLIEYPDVYGQGIILCGDSYNGRVKKMLVRNTVPTEPGTDTDTLAAYECLWRGGFVERQAFDADVILDATSMLVPGTSLTLTATLWEQSFVVRAESDLDATQPTPQDYDKTSLKQPITLPAGGGRRFISLALSYDSTAGANGARLMELGKYTEYFLVDQSNS